MSKKRKIPIWVTEFQREIDKLKKKTKNGDIYQYPQGNLEILKKTGRGDCIAISRLFREILRKHNIDRVQHLVVGVMDPKDEANHQITVVYEDKEKIWLQSNEKILCFKALHLLIKYSENEMAWNKKGFMIIKKAWLSWC